jgi:hypothetical protein
LPHKTTNATLTLSQVAKVLAAVYGMRANADPTLVVACLHAVRGLATRHEGNAHALGKETLLCIRSLSKANANNADLVGAPSWTRLNINQSIHQSINQSINQSTYRTNGHLVVPIWTTLSIQHVCAALTHPER